MLDRKKPVYEIRMTRTVYVQASNEDEAREILKDPDFLLAQGDFMNDREEWKELDPQADLSEYETVFGKQHGEVTDVNA